MECAWSVPKYLEEFYKASGADVDQHGRWVHPLAIQIVEANIPLCTGYGVSYEDGENVVLDTVVDDGTNVLFNTYKDGGRMIPSLVGGILGPPTTQTLKGGR